MRFIYKAKDGPGKTIKGELEADSRQMALNQLDSMGYSPIWVKEQDVDRPGARVLLNRRISQRDINVFTRQLASLIKSRVPILKALNTVAGQTESAGFQNVIRGLEHDVRDGSMLSEALSKHINLFSELYVNMVRSGESGGIMDAILMRLSEALEKEEDTKRKLQSAMAYPILIAAVGVFTVFALLVFFLPRVVVLFEGYHNLPLPTKMLIGITDFVSDYWYWILLIVFLLTAILRRIASIETGKVVFDQMKLRLPLISKFIRDVDLARFARTFSLLLNAGIPIAKALDLSSTTLRNAVLRAEIEKVCRDTIQQGLPLSVCMARTEYFPAFVANMMAVGEEAGHLDEALDEVASFYEKEVEQRSRLAVSLLEPVLILLVGAIVGFIVAAMLLPIFELGSAF